MGELLRDRPASFWKSGVLAVMVESGTEPPFTLHTTAGSDIDEPDRSGRDDDGD